MSKLDELIEKLCPNGVEYKKTKELKKDSFWLMPATPYYISEGIPYITSKNIKDGKINFENVNYISQEDYINISANRKIERNDLLVTMIGTIGETAFVEDNTEFYGQNMYLIRLDDTKINRKFYNYYLTSPKIKNLLITKRNISNQGYIKAGNLEELSIPVPPLEIQSEIVEILDKFTALLAELKAELKARKKQYAYYRDMFVNKEKNKCLIEVLKIRHGKDYKVFEKGNIPVYGSGGIIAYTSKFAYDKPSVLIPRKGSLNKLYYVEEPFWNVDTIFYTEIDETIAIPKYVFYCLENEHLEELNIAGGVPSLTQSTLNNVKIFIPDLEEQRKIVDNLDKLYYLINSLTEGIPAEIEARQKQYEYYREKLLTFKELVMEE